MEQIKVHVGEQMDGFTYRLDPLSRDKIRKRFSNVQPASSLFISYDTKSDFEAMHGRLWYHIVEILTGLQREQMQELDFVFMDPKSGKILFRPPIPQNV